MKTRIRRNRLLRGAAAGLAAGLGAAILLQAVSFFLPISDRGLWAAGLAAAVMLLTALGNALRPVKNRTAAEAADACGLKERTITALEAGGNTPIHELQRRDALKALEGLDVKKIRPGSVRKPLNEKSAMIKGISRLLNARMERSPIPGIAKMYSMSRLPEISPGSSPASSETMITSVFLNA